MTLTLEHLRVRAPAQSKDVLLAPLPVGGDTLSTSRVNDAIRSLLGPSQEATQRRWLRAVATLVLGMRPDIGQQIVSFLRTTTLETSNPLSRLSIGEIGVVYEALIALTDRKSRKTQGQYFTPDDVAAFMAGHASTATGRFPDGVWLDPCCGVGNLSWHLAHAMEDPATFVTDRLTLIDVDEVALNTAIALLVASFASPGDSSALSKLATRSVRRDFLETTSLPNHDFVIVNPPYAATSRIDRFRTAATRELYAYFLERIATESRGFIAITPASHLGGVKYAPLRELLGERAGGDVVVFDNVPDTCFRGYKYGSTNTSKTNFVRASIIVSSPTDSRWRVTPILRWATRSRPQMWRAARNYLVPLRKGPSGEWAKVMPGTEQLWDALSDASTRLGDLLADTPTEYALEVASTPRYYVSASKRKLDRASKHVLHFTSREDWDRAYVLLNSSLPYWWWRCLDGGITLPMRTLRSLPVPPSLDVDDETVELLMQSDRQHLVTKLNAGRYNENVRRPRSLVTRIDEAVLSGIEFDFEAVFSSDMFGDIPPGAQR